MGDLTEIGGFEADDIVVCKEEGTFWTVTQKVTSQFYVYVKPFGMPGTEPCKAFSKDEIRYITMLELCTLRLLIDNIVVQMVQTDSVVAKQR